MLRKARIKDITKIQKLINYYAKKDKMLPRSLNELYDTLRDYWVYEKKDKILGCCALHIFWGKLAEIKSLAVDPREKKRGIGKDLIYACIKEAQELGAEEIFVLTYIPEYFKKFGFRKIPHYKLPKKVWVECINCPKFPKCKEVSMVKKI